MDQKSITRYLLPFLQNSEIGNVSLVVDRGAIRYEPELVSKLNAGQLGTEDIDMLLKTGDIDVRRDNLVKVFYVECGERKYHVLIVEYLELFEKDYVAGIVPFNAQ